MTASPVRISDKLKTQIINSIDQLYAWFLEDINKQKPDVGDRIYDLMYGPHLDGMSRLPVSFFRTSQSFDTRMVDETPLFCTFNLSQPRLMGFSHPKGQAVERSDFGDKINIHRTEETAEIVDAILEWWNRKAEQIKLCDAGIKAVRAVLNQHRSLSPAIKMFPPLIDLIPAYVRIRMEVPQHRLSSVQMELNPHLKRLASDIARKKMMNR